MSTDSEKLKRYMWITESTKQVKKKPQAKNPHINQASEGSVTTFPVLVPSTSQLISTLQNTNNAHLEDSWIFRACQYSF